MQQITFICGPTASGKSALALELAQKTGAIIINGDAMQVYRQLPIITASPSELDKSLVKHYLYNHIDIDQHYSVAKYIAQVLDVVKDHNKDYSNVPIIIVGGSGMYINSLIYGMHKIPDVSYQIRSYVNGEIEQFGIAVVYEKLQKLDPMYAAKLKPADTKRIARGYEVFLQTGCSIATFYSDENLYQPLQGFDIKIMLLDPERTLSYQACDARFDLLVKSGIIDEAQKLLPMWDDFQTSAKKALGLAQIIDYLKGYMSLQDAVSSAKTATRNFAKRQVTWFKHQLKSPQIISCSIKSVHQW
jgi:tRNA dimethylallyltransferase